MRLYKYILILWASSITAQTISITVDNINIDKVLLYSIQGEKTFLIDSINAASDNLFCYKIVNKKISHGLFRFAFHKNQMIDLIYDGRDISIKTDARNVLDSLLVITSESNKLYYSFIRLNKAYKTKVDLMNLILARYPKDDYYYEQTRLRLQELQNDYLKFVNFTAQKEPGSFTARYIRSAQLPVIDSSIPQEKQQDYLQAHALDFVNFIDASLINSDLFTNKTIEYLTYFRNPQLPKELLEKEFMKAVDTILNKAKVNQLVYKHITEYLIDGFKKFGFDKILDYIVENYVIKDDICLDVKTEGMIQKRIQQAKLFKIGSIVPDIVLPDSSGECIKLNSLNTDKLLVIFYSSWCQHCKELIPKLKELYNTKKKQFELFAVSLDTDRDTWLKFIKDNCGDWLNITDLKGWDSKAAIDYYIYATPTMFLLNKDKKIIGKPITLDELKQLL